MNNPLGAPDDASVHGRSGDEAALWALVVGAIIFLALLRRAFKGAVI